jgi:hypothetical protein
MRMKHHRAELELSAIEALCEVDENFNPVPYKDSGITENLTLLNLSTLARPHLKPPTGSIPPPPGTNQSTKPPALISTGSWENKSYETPQGPIAERANLYRISGS